LTVVHCAEIVRGGIATYLNELLPLQAAELGPDAVTLLAPASQAQDLRDLPGVRRVLFPDRGGRVRGTWNLVLALRRILEETRPQVVHVESTFAGVGVRLYLALARWPGVIIYCPQGWAFDRHMSRAGRAVVAWVERRLAPLCHAIVCISDHERESAEAAGIDPGRLVVIPSGMADLEGPCPGPLPLWPAGLLRVLFVGRFDRQKGVDVFFRAMAALQGKAWAYAVGDVVLKEDPLPPAPPNVTRTGWLDRDQWRAYAETAQVLVVPSRWEGFGLVALDGMRCALPVIASRVGGLKEIVVDGATGFLVPPDDWRTLADLLAATGPGRLAAMGRAGRERFLERYSIQRVHQSLLRLYREAGR
jgi:glycosyltransferase involved in cell wall biosynthesis